MNPVLYKYFDFNDNFKKSMQNGYLWFSDPTKFNDPFEFRLQVDENLDDEDILEFYELYKKLSANPSKSLIADFNSVLLRYRTNPEKFIEFYLEPFVKYIRNFGICCFSNVYDSILMWSHYANKHTGVVVEFDEQKLDESIYKMNDKVRVTVIDKVAYSKEFPIIKISSSLKKISEEIKNVVFTKSSDWEYEKEVRIISKRTEEHIFDRSCVKSVYLGHKFADENKKELKQLLHDYFPNQKIPIKEMTIDDRSYSLKIKNT